MEAAYACSDLVERRREVMPACAAVDVRQGEFAHLAGTWVRSAGQSQKLARKPCVTPSTPNSRGSLETLLSLRKATGGGRRKREPAPVGRRAIARLASWVDSRGVVHRI